MLENKRRRQVQKIIKADHKNTTKKSQSTKQYQPDRENFRKKHTKKTNCYPRLSSKRLKIEKQQTNFGNKVISDFLIDVKKKGEDEIRHFGDGNFCGGCNS